MRNLLSPAFRRGGWGLLGQGANSLSNLAVAVVVARTAGVDSFGGWALGYAAYVLILGASRAVAATPLMLSESNSTAAMPRAHLRGCLGASVLVAVAGSAVLLASGFALSGDLRRSFWAFAVLMPGLLTQDAVRYIYFTRRQPAWAASCDLTWGLVQALGFLLLAGQSLPGVVAPTLVWGLAATVSAIPFLSHLRAFPGPVSGVRFLRDHWVWVPRLAADYIVGTASSQAVPYALAAVAGLSATAGLRGAQVLFGPVNVVVLGLTPIATVEAVRLASQAGSPLHTFVRNWSALIAAVSLFFGVSVLAMPDRFGRAVLGDSWEVSQPLLLALTVQAVLRGPVTGSQIAIRARTRIQESLSLRVQTALPLLGLPLTGAVMADERGAAWGLAAGMAIAAVLSLARLRATESDSMAQS